MPRVHPSPWVGVLASPRDAELVQTALEEHDSDARFQWLVWPFNAVEIAAIISAVDAVVIAAKIDNAEDEPVIARTLQTIREARRGMTLPTAVAIAVWGHSAWSLGRQPHPGLVVGDIDEPFPAERLLVRVTEVCADTPVMPARARCERLLRARPAHEKLAQNSDRLTALTAALDASTRARMAHDTELQRLAELARDAATERDRARLDVARLRERIAALGGDLDGDTAARAKE